MSPVTLVMTCFALLGALDRIFGNRLGLGKEFEKGFQLLGTISLSMLGILVLVPVLARMMESLFVFVEETLNLDPSLVPAMFLASDLGAASLGKTAALSEKMGLFNGLVVSSMMGCTVSFTIPYTLGAVDKRQHREWLLGLMCGIATIPLGVFVGGLVCGIPMGALLGNLLPLALFAAVIAVGLLRCPEVCVRIFSAFGGLIKIVITIGLGLAILRYATGVEVIEGMDTLENAMGVCLSVSVVISGAFPMLKILSKILDRPLAAAGRWLGVDQTAVTGLLSSTATILSTVDTVKEMSPKGVVINAAFGVSGSFVFASHLAFTLAWAPEMLAPVMVGKLTAGAAAVAVACWLSKRVLK